MAWKLVGPSFLPISTKPSRTLHISGLQQLEKSRNYFSPFKHHARALSTPSERGSLSDAASTNLAKRSWLKQKWDVIKHEAHHYWVGTKLLGTEIMICVRILRQVLAGEALTRREYRQLRTTAADVLKMVPFVIIVIVPFLELALPLILYFFPNMLPSTFRQELKKEDDMKRQLKARIEVAKFLQDTVETMGVELEKRSKCATAAEFVAFMRRVRDGDATVTNDDIARFAQLFTDDITLDNVGRHQLVHLCKLLDIPAFGSDFFLKFQLLQRIKEIKTDDAMIEAEGIDSLTLQEVRDALAYRGMRATDLSEAGYRRDLKAWLDLSNKALPTSLLLMSRAFKLTAFRAPPAAATVATDAAAALAGDASDAEALKQALQGMPKEAVESAEAKALQPDKLSEARKRLEELHKEEELIEEERRERQAALDAEVAAAAARFLESGAGQELLGGKDDAVLAGIRTAMAGKFPTLAVKDARYTAIFREKIAERRAAPAAPAAAATPGPAEAPVPPAEAVAAAATAAAAVGMAAAVVAAGTPPGPKKPVTVELNADEVGQIAEVVAMLANKESATAEEREDIEDLRQEIAEAAHLTKTRDDAGAQVEKSTKRLGQTVARLLHRLEKDLAHVDTKIGTRLNLLDKDGDGVISEAELREVVDRVLKRKLDDSQVAYVMRMLDTDGDGQILVREVEALAQSMEREKEEMIEDEDTGEELKKGRDLINMPPEQMTEEQAALYGALVEEYRDKVREVRESVAAQRRRDAAAAVEPPPRPPPAPAPTPAADAAPAAPPPPPPAAAGN